MAKDVFCFICKKPVEVQDERAIAKLCDEHDTPQNREDMVNTPTRQLLGIQNEGLQILVESNKDATNISMDEILKAISDIKNQLDNLPTTETIIKEVESAPAPTNKLSSGDVNEFGEVI
jgi:hypothetical protein